MSRLPRVMQIVLLVALAALLSPRPAAACQCDATPPCLTFWLADLVFTGVVTDVKWVHQGTPERSRSRAMTTVVVERMFRGGDESKQFVLSSVFSSCDFPFQVGKRYIVYAKHQPDGTVTATQCTGTKLLEEAGADLDFAEHLPPAGSGGRVYGTVRRYFEDLLDRTKSRDEPAARASIVVVSENGQRSETTTAADGSYAINGLAPGKYTLSAEFAPDLESHYTREFTLADRGCAQVGMGLTSNGRIAGRVVDAAGRPVARAPVRAYPKAYTNRSDFPNASLAGGAHTDAAGRYQIGPLPPGEYVLGVNTDWGPQLHVPFAATWYPGVPARSNALTITVGEGTEQKNVDLVLSAKLRQTSVSGTIVIGEGTPVPGASVILVAAGTALGTSSGTTQSDGTFTLAAVAGVQYELRASLYANGVSATAKMNVTAREEPLTGLVLTLIMAPAKRQPRAFSPE